MLTIKNGRMKKFIMIGAYIFIMLTIFGVLQRERITFLTAHNEGIENDMTLSLDEQCSMHNMTIEGNTLVVEGEDPYVVIDCIDGYVEEVRLKQIQPQGVNLSLYYDNGSLFNERDKSSFRKDKNGDYLAKVESNVSVIRIDIEDSTSSLTIHSVTITYANKTILFHKGIIYIIFYALVDFILGAFLFLLVKKEKYFRERHYGIPAIAFYCIEKYLFSIAYISKVSLGIKVTLLFCNVLLILAVLFMLNKRKWYARLAFLMGIGCFYFAWSLILPFNCGPDEHMRYLIPQYIYKYNAIPRAEDPAITSSVWGFSYGFTPIFSYIISAIFMKVCGIFSTAEASLLMAARLPSVLFSVGTIAFSMLISKKLFKSRLIWVMPIMIAFLPQFAFISTYVNNDAMAIFSVSWIIYGMLYGKEKKWNFKSCILLGSGIGVCLMSYYNAYGIIIVAVLYCIISVLRDKEINNKWRFIILRVIWVAVPVLIIAGWWFARNYVLYRDVLGLNASSYYAEKNALEAYKPSNRGTPANQKLSLKYMLLDMKWIETSWRSFIGNFGSMSMPLKEIHYFLMSFVFEIGIGVKLILRRKKELNDPGKVDDRGLFDILMVLMCIITICISIYYSYFNDFQPQGRYCLPMLISFMYLVISGYEKLADDSVMEKRIYVIVMGYACILLDVFVNIVLPYYGA